MRSESTASKSYELNPGRMTYHQAQRTLAPPPPHPHCVDTLVTSTAADAVAFHFCCYKWHRSHCLLLLLVPRPLLLLPLLLLMTLLLLSQHRCCCWSCPWCSIVTAYYG